MEETLSHHEIPLYADILFSLITVEIWIFILLYKEKQGEGWDSNVEMSLYIRFQILMLLFFPSGITFLEGI